MVSWRNNQLELLFLCQIFNSSGEVGKTAKTLKLSLDASRSLNPKSGTYVSTFIKRRDRIHRRQRISELVRDKIGLNAQVKSSLCAVL
jgi:hypothetical protein